MREPVCSNGFGLVSVAFVAVLVGCEPGVVKHGKPDGCAPPLNPTLAVDAVVCTAGTADLSVTYAPSAEASDAVEFWDGNAWGAVDTLETGVATKQGVLPGEGYRFRLRRSLGTCAATDFVESTNVSVVLTPANPALAVPSDDCLAAPTPATVTWTPVAGETYAVEFWDGADWVGVDAQAAGSATKNDVGVGSGYKFRVTAAVGACAASAATESATFTRRPIPINPMLTVPTSQCLAAVASQSASWSPVVGESYEVGFWDGGSWLVPDTIGTGTATVSSVAEGAGYLFRIRTTADGCVAADYRESDIFSITLEPANPTLAAVQDLCGEDLPLTTTFTATGGVDYEVELWDGATWLVAAVVGGSASLPGLGSAVGLKWRVRASKDGCNAPAWSETDPFAVRICAVGWIGGGADDWQTGNAPSSGTGANSFSYPIGIAASGGVLYVTELSNHRVSRWRVYDHDNDADTPEVMAAAGWLGGGQDGWQTGDAPAAAYDLNSFSDPWGIAVDGDGNLYIADWQINRVSKWDTNGNAVGWVGQGSAGWQTGTSTGGLGNSVDWLRRPEGLALDSNGNIYVADYGNNRIAKWSADGNAIGWLGGGSDGWQTGDGATSGASYRHLSAPVGVWVDGDGAVYAAELGNNRVSKWSAEGNAVGWIGGGSDGWKTDDGASAGADFRSFDEAYGVQVVADGTLYVLDYVNNRISKWTGDGTALGWIGHGFDGWQTIDTEEPSYGNGLAWFSYPYGNMVVTSTGIYVPDSDNSRVTWWR